MKSDRNMVKEGERKIERTFSYLYIDREEAC
jgi:hypothetical protein